MNLTAHISFYMVHSFVNVVPAGAVVAHSLIGLDLRAVFNILEDFVLQSLALHIRYNLCPHLPGFMVVHSHDHGLVAVALRVLVRVKVGSGITQFLCATFVHVSQLAADK